MARVGRPAEHTLRSVASLDVGAIRIAALRHDRTDVPEGINQLLSASRESTALRMIASILEQRFQKLSTRPYERLEICRVHEMAFIKLEFQYLVSIEYLTVEVHEPTTTSGIESIADKTLRDLQRFPSNKEISPRKAIMAHLPKRDENGKRRKRALSTQDEFDITDALFRKAKNYGLYLDSSAYAGMAVGTPFNIPFRVRNVAVGSDGPTILFRFECGGHFRRYPSLAILEFADGVDASFSRDGSLHSDTSTPITERQVEELQDTLVALGAPDWEEDYYAPIFDGIQWELSFKLGDRQYHSGGSNAFPEGFDSLVNYLNESFGCSFR